MLLAVPVTGAEYPYVPSKFLVIQFPISLLAAIDEELQPQTAAFPAPSTVFQLGTLCINPSKPGYRAHAREGKMAT